MKNRLHIEPGSPLEACRAWDRHQIWRFVHLVGVGKAHEQVAARMNISLDCVQALLADEHVIQQLDYFKKICAMSADEFNDLLREQVDMAMKFYELQETLNIPSSVH